MKLTEQTPRPLPGEASSDSTSFQLGGLNVRIGSAEDRVDLMTEIGLEGVMVLKDCAIDGLWHLTDRSVDDFTDAGIPDISYTARHGRGTYVGWGSQTGTQIRELQRSDHERHDLRFRGTALMVPYEQLGYFLPEASELYGNLDAGMRDLLKHLEEDKADNPFVEGKGINGAFFYWPEGDGGEGVVWHPSNHLHSVGREIVAGQR